MRGGEACRDIGGLADLSTQYHIVSWAVLRATFRSGSYVVFPKTSLGELDFAMNALRYAPQTVSRAAREEANVRSGKIWAFLTRHSRLTLEW